MGFSLIELVMVIAIIGIIGVFGAQIFLEATDAFSVARDRRDLIQEARYALERMSREIREKIDSASSDITTFTSTNFTFNDTSGNSISFSKSGSNLLRNSDTLASNVSDLTYSYFKADGTTASAASDVWRVRISLTVAKGDLSATLRTQFFPRNLYNDNANFASWAEQ